MKLSENSWKSQDSFPSIEAIFGKNMPEQEMIRYDITDGFLCLSSYVPIMGEEFNKELKKMMPKQVGVLKATFKPDHAFFDKIAEITETKINIFSEQGLSLGNIKEYGSYDFSRLGNAKHQKIMLNEIEVNKNQYFQGSLPIHNDSGGISAIAVLYSKKFATSNTLQIIRYIA
ncbi:MAG TPA: hypothetical protein DCQ37_04945 [Desulfobacteraceae bacterium]|nr:hypothetical protein [Desulfobacteraceae bacterium]